MKTYFIFAGKALQGGYFHYELPSLEKNDGKRLIDHELERCIFKKKRRYGGIGAIYEAEKEGDSSYKIGQTPIGYWKNAKDILEFQILDRNNKIAASKIKDNQKQLLKETLGPLNEIYRKLNFTQRSAFLAEIINIVTL